MKKLISILLASALLTSVFTVSAGAAAPTEDVMTRGALVERLHELSDSPKAEKPADFTDVPADASCAAAVAWAAETGIIAGYGDGRFGPGDPITREQLAVVLHRLHQKLQGQTPEGSAESLAAYADAGKAGAWAVPALQWAAAEGALREDTLLDPQGTLSWERANDMIFTVCGLGMVDIYNACERSYILEQAGSMHWINDNHHNNTQGEDPDYEVYIAEGVGVYHWFNSTPNVRFDNGMEIFIDDEGDRWAYYPALGDVVHENYYNNPHWFEIDGALSMNVIDAYLEDGKYYVTVREKDFAQIYGNGFDPVFMGEGYVFQEGSFLQSLLVLDAETMLLQESIGYVLHPDGTEKTYSHTKIHYGCEMPEDAKTLLEDWKKETDRTDFTVVERPGTPEEITHTFDVPKGDYVAIWIPYDLGVASSHEIYEDAACTRPTGRESFRAVEDEMNLYIAERSKVADLETIMAANRLDVLVEKFGSASSKIETSDGFSQLMYADARFTNLDSGAEGSFIRAGNSGYQEYEGELSLLVAGDSDAGEEYPFLFGDSESFLNDYFITRAKLTEEGLMVTMQMSEEDTQTAISGEELEDTEGATLRCDVLLDPESYAFRNMTETLERADGTEESLSTVTFAYGVQAPEEAETLYARMGEREDGCTLTLVLSPGTQEEQRSEYAAVKGDKVIFFSHLREEYDFFADEGCTQAVDPTAVVLEGDLVIYAVPSAK